MAVLDRKLLRDLFETKGQALAIALIIGAGIALFVMSLSTMSSLQQAQEIYYARYRFADIFSGVKRAPVSLGERIAEIPGVTAVQLRVVMDVTLDIPKMAEPAIGRLISVPESSPPRLNDLHIRRGRYIEPGRSDEVLISEAFAEAQNLDVGDQISAILNGRLKELRIVGIALSPEYVYSLRGGELFPDDRHFGVFWMGEKALAAAFNMEGAFNDVTLSVMPGGRLPEIIDQLDRILEPYGSTGAIERANQVSHFYLSNEFNQLQTMGLLLPAIFLAVAAFLLNVVLARIIGIQREQIGALKAFGYSNSQIVIHYLKLVAIIVAAGTILGTLAGSWFGLQMTQLYTEFFRLPLLVYRFSFPVAVGAFLISLSAAAIGALGSVRGAARLSPAVAMRPAPPGVYRKTFIERLGLERVLSMTPRMILRGWERRPAKTILSCFGISFAVAVLIVGSFSLDAIEFLIGFQFNYAQREDITVTFVEPRSRDALYEIEKLPGVLRVEPFRSVATRIVYRNRSRRLAIQGLTSQSDLHRPIEADGKPVVLSKEGLTLSRKLAELLDVGIGERVILELLEGERKTYRVTVVQLAEEFLGLSAYMQTDALNRLIQEGPVISGVFILADPFHEAALYERLKRTPSVATVSLTRNAVQSFRETLAETIYIFTFFNILFAGVIAVGVVYNNARIILSERSRDLASLRVLGFTRAEISAILLGELGALTFLALPIGCLLGYLMAAGLTRTLDTELYRIPLIINNDTYLFAAVVVVIASAVSAFIVRHRLDHLDLVGVLKTRE
ncbi:MAG TPA: FtsX-like permease family protein [Acidobacteriota bacterium]|nr:FtsX-like permease family protein [Acidobacteriota bacterium]